MFCSKIITKPIPNSTADKTKKKNVRERRLILSVRNPRDKTIRYNVIQSISAVNNKCNAFEILNDILKSIKKNKIK